VVGHAGLKATPPSVIFSKRRAVFGCAPARTELAGIIARDAATQKWSSPPRRGGRCAIAASSRPLDRWRGFSPGLLQAFRAARTGTAPAQSSPNGRRLAQKGRFLLAETVELGRGPVVEPPFRCRAGVPPTEWIDFSALLCSVRGERHRDRPSGLGRRRRHAAPHCS